MIKAWTDEAWEDFTYWTRQDRKTLKRILLLLQDIDRNGYAGIGKPERLSGDLSSYWSRRIDDANRIVYRIEKRRDPDRPVRVSLSGPLTPRRPSGRRFFAFSHQISTECTLPSLRYSKPPCEFFDVPIDNLVASRSKTSTRCYF